MPTEYKSMWWAIDGVLAGMGVPFIAPLRRNNAGGALAAHEDALPSIHRSGIRAVVSLLNHPGDVSIFETAGFEFKCFPIHDGHPPALRQAQEFVEFVDSCRSRDLPVGVFCVGGIGRTGTMIACYLIHTGKTAVEAVAQIRTREPLAVETGSQLGFLHDFELLQRR